MGIVHCQKGIEMKEFEKTWFKDVIGHDDTNPAHVMNKATAKRYWMLALRWALSNKTDSGYIGEIIIVDIIEKELENE